MFQGPFILKNNRCISIEENIYDDLLYIIRNILLTFHGHIHTKYADVRFILSGN